MNFLKVLLILCSGVFTLAASAKGAYTRLPSSDNTVSSNETATAIIHCSEEAQGLLPDAGAYIQSVEGSSREISADVSEKVIIIKSQRGGGWSGPEKPVASLSATVRIDRSRMASDGPVKLTWSCKISK